MDHMQLKQMTVLVVDGNPSDSQQLQLYLSRKVRFTSVRNGKDALGFLAQSPINLLLIADNLPDMTAVQKPPHPHDDSRPQSEKRSRLCDGGSL